MVSVIPFTKMQGIGNDFVVIDALKFHFPQDRLSSLSRAMCDRRLGVGADGLIVLGPGKRLQFSMEMLNPDGSASEMCGNGIRCLALLALDHKHSNEATFQVETGAGDIGIEHQGNGSFRVDMGTARLRPSDIPMTGALGESFVDQPIRVGNFSLAGTAVSMGNPHFVIFPGESEVLDLSLIGPIIENASVFPQRTNVHIAGVKTRRLLTQRTWERGAGLTYACGTGACAVAVAGFVSGRSDRMAEVELPGGKLAIEIDDRLNVWMTGPAQTTFEGEFGFNPDAIVESAGC